MLVVDLIRAKRNGQELSPEDLRALIQAYTKDEVPDYQMSAFLMTIYFQGMTDAELAAWTDAMLHSGQVMDANATEGFKVDKHSTGGVGDKVSLILAPLAVAMGLTVPMVAGRGLGHTGGTLDKLEAIPGFNVFLPPERFLRHLNEIGGVIAGQTEEIAPADKRIYALRDVTATVECIPLIASSIMSKKLAEGIHGLVLDIKVGNGAFMKNVADASILGETMIAIGDRMDCQVRAMLTDMNQPLGLMVGNTLETQECIQIMQGDDRAKDLIDLTVALTVEMMDVASPLKDWDATQKRVRDALLGGQALDVFRKMVEAQGGDAEVCDAPTKVMPVAHEVTDFVAQSSGFITHMDTQQIGVAGVELGGGRKKKEDDIDHAVGFVFHKKLGDYVEKGESIASIHFNDAARYEAALKRLKPAIVFGEQAVECPELIKKIIGRKPQA